MYWGQLSQHTEQNYGWTTEESWFNTRQGLRNLYTASMSRPAPRLIVTASVSPRVECLTVLLVA